MDFEPLNNKNSSLPFLQMPKFIFEMEGISSTAKLAYVLIYDRIRQGQGNERFTDKCGNCFCYFSDDELAKQLSVSKETVKKTISELKKRGLLKREKTGFTKVETTLFVPAQSVKNDTFESVNFDHFESVKNYTSKVSKITPSYPYINKEQMSNNNEQEKKADFVPEKPKEKTKKKTKNKEKNEAEDKQAKEAAEAIIEHWNKSYQTKYSPTTKTTVDLVKALLKNNYTMNQILEVIDYKAKSRKTEADYRWFVPSTVLRLKNFERNCQFMDNDQKRKQSGVKTVYGSQPSQGYKNRNKIPESVTLPEWYQVKESEQASHDDVQKILELQNQILNN